MWISRAVIAVAVVGGCAEVGNREEPPPAGLPTTAPPADLAVGSSSGPVRALASLRPAPAGASRSAPEIEADSLVTGEVRRAIRMSDRLSEPARQVAVSTLGGVVTLRGAVTNGDEKAEITNLARGVPGVTFVDCQVVVEVVPTN